MDVSIIIPCYNAGAYLSDALQSVAASEGIAGDSYEVIIVDDGSTDSMTIDLLDKLDPAKYTVIYQGNRGPGGARNTGVKAAAGKYILFLDSDNKIRPDFIATGIKLLDGTDADIVYGKPAFFGATTLPRFKTREFDLEAILVVNHIDICSIMRKQIFDALGGFDEDRRLIAFEDWDLWIRAGSAGYKFHFINKVMFDYRITNHSLLDEKNDAVNHQKVVSLLYQKHNQLVLDAYRKICPPYVVYKRDERKPLRTFFKHVYYKYIRGIVDIHAINKKD